MEMEFNMNLAKLFLVSGGLTASAVYGINLDFSDIVSDAANTTSLETLEFGSSGVQTENIGNKYLISDVASGVDAILEYSGKTDNFVVTGVSGIPNAGFGNSLLVNSNRINEDISDGNTSNPPLGVSTSFGDFGYAQFTMTFIVADSLTINSGVFSGSGTGNPLVGNPSLLFWDVDGGDFGNQTTNRQIADAVEIFGANGFTIEGNDQSALVGELTNDGFLFHGTTSVTGLGGTAVSDDPSAAGIAAFPDSTIVNSITFRLGTIDTDENVFNDGSTTRALLLSGETEFIAFANPVTVPEPSSVGLLLGLSTLFMIARRNRK